MNAAATQSVFFGGKVLVMGAACQWILKVNLRIAGMRGLSVQSPRKGNSHPMPVAKEKLMQAA